MRLKFWGTRGLISSPRHDTAIFGGNTPCIQILHEDELIVVDTGFGMCNFGEALKSRLIHAREDLTIHIFYTHFHWDHVQGLPFFEPIYFTNTQINIYSPTAKAVTHENLNILFDGSYSPFQGLLNMPSEIKIRQLQKQINLNGLKITFQPVDHGETIAETAGIKTYAYRFEAEGADGPESLCIVTDHEARPSPINDGVIAFCRDTDVLVHDGQYTEAEYQGQYENFGHSTATQALNNALAANAKYTLLTHHAPTRSDRELQTLHRQLTTIEQFRNLNFDFAREETEYAVSQKLSDKVPKAG